MMRLLPLTAVVLSNIGVGGSPALSAGAAGDGAPVLKYLGAMYRMDEPDEVDRALPRELTVEMSGYLLNLVERFEKEYGVPLRRVKTPYPT